MANLILSSTEAQTLYNTGRLIRTVDCDWQPPQNSNVYSTTQYANCAIVQYWFPSDSAPNVMKSQQITPPLEVGAVYDVIEPCFSTEARSNSLVITYGDSPIGKHASGTASRQQATPTYKLIIEEGKLRWYEELKTV